MNHDSPNVRRRPDRRGRWRRWFRLGLALGMSGLAVGVLMPIWFPWVFSAVAGGVGMGYEAYERVGWGRFAVRDLRMDWEGLGIRVQRMEAPLPTVWCWQRWWGERGWGGRPRVEVEGWELRVEAAAPEVDAEPISLPGVLEEVEQWIAGLRPWLGYVRLGQGVLKTPMEVVEVPLAIWDEGELRARAEVASRREALDVVIGWPEVGTPSFRLGLVPGGDWVDGRLERVEGLWRGVGELEWQGVSGSWKFLTAERGWAPREATLEVAEFRVPAARVGLLPYDWLTGSVHLDWREGRYEGRLEVAAEPGADRAWFTPAARGVAMVHGDLREFHLDDLQLQSTWASVRLSSPVGVDRSGQLLTGAARLSVEADLGAGPIRGLVGRVNGVVQMRGDTLGAAEWGLQLRGERVGWGGHEDAEFTVAAGWDGSAVGLERLEVVLAGDSRLEARGNWEVREGRLRGGEWKLAGRPPVRYLPAGWSASEWSGQGTVEGVPGELEHAGHVRVNGLTLGSVVVPEAELEWSGVETTVWRWDARLRQGETGVTVAGEGRLDLGAAVGAEVVLREVGVDLAGEGMRLESPVTLRWRQTASAGAGDGGALWTAELEGLRLAGANREVAVSGRVEWPTRGRMSCRLGGLATKDFREWWPESLPMVRVERLEAAGEWEEGKLELRAEGEGQAEVESVGGVRWGMRVRGDESGLEVGRLELRQGEELVVGLTGRVPVRVALSAAGADWGWVEGAGFELSGEVSGRGRVGAHWLEPLGVEIRDVRLRWDLSGPGSDPELAWEGSVERAEWAGSPGKRWPAVERMTFGGGWSQGELRLRDGVLEVLGQRVEFGVAMPWQPVDERGGWGAVGKLDIGAVTGHLRIPGMELASCSAFLPEVMEPRGDLSADVVLGAGLEMRGGVTVAGVATRPMGVLGAIRDGGLRLRLEGRTATIEEGSAIYLGAPLRLAGQGSWVAGVGPRFDLKLTGVDVPLVRQEGIVIRSDVDVRLARTNDAPPQVSGEVRIQRSLIVQDLGMLVPGTARPEDRPPYFRVESGPLATWRLELGIRSDRGVRVLAPVLRGEASASLRLGGTLGDPVLAGEVRLNSGKVLFPFGSLEVGFASVTMTADNPADPGILMNAGGNVSGYQVTMDLGGTARHPEVMLVSSPPLGTQDILMMLASGQLPQGERRYSSTEKLGYLGLFLGRDVMTRLGLSESSAERLILRSSRRSTRDGRPSYEVEYRLSEDWSAVGQYDQYGGINGGFKWRVYSR